MIVTLDHDQWILKQCERRIFTCNKSLGRFLGRNHHNTMADLCGADKMKLDAAGQNASSAVCITRTRSCAVLKIITGLRQISLTIDLRTEMAGAIRNAFYNQLQLLNPECAVRYKWQWHDRIKRGNPREVPSIIIAISWHHVTRW